MSGGIGPKTGVAGGLVCAAYIIGLGYIALGQLAAGATLFGAAIIAHALRDR